jgi:hypothetical protein
VNRTSHMEVTSAGINYLFHYVPSRNRSRRVAHLFNWRGRDPFTYRPKPEKTFPRCQSRSLIKRWLVNRLVNARLDRTDEPLPVEQGVMARRDVRLQPVNY